MAALRLHEGLKPRLEKLRPLGVRVDYRGFLSELRWALLVPLLLVQVDSSGASLLLEHQGQKRRCEARESHSKSNVINPELSGQVSDL